MKNSSINSTLDQVYEMLFSGLKEYSKEAVQTTMRELASRLLTEIAEYQTLREGLTKSSGAALKALREEFLSKPQGQPADSRLEDPEETILSLEPDSLDLNKAE